MSDILAIHNYLFQNVYAWAGQYRKVNISKSGNPFMPIQSFNTAETHMNHLIHSYHQTANSKDEIIMHLIEILDNLNYFHPFREGNGRTQREVIRALALSKVTLHRYEWNKTMKFITSIWMGQSMKT